MAQGALVNGRTAVINRAVDWRVGNLKSRKMLAPVAVAPIQDPGSASKNLITKLLAPASCDWSWGACCSAGLLARPLTGRQ